MSLSLHIGRDSILGSEDICGSEILSISSQTWGRDSHELFDYETSQTNNQQFRVAGRAVDLYRRGNEVVIVPEGVLAPPLSEYLLSTRFEKSCGAFRVIQRDGVGNKKLWSVVRSNNPSGVRLREGLVIKLGRFKLRVRQVCTKIDESDDKTSCSSCDSPSSTRATHRAPFKPFGIPDLSLGDRRIISALSVNDCEGNNSIRHLQCRICLCEGPAEDDPLICPCECTGSIRYVHAACLRHWLQGRLGLENFNGSVYFFRPLACELCHCVYPTYFESEGNRIPLAGLPETKVPFIIFENMGGFSQIPAWNSDASNTFPTGLHVARFGPDRSPLKIGRGHECQMRISDVSISRLHALLRIDDDGYVFLEDQQSKFGTLVDSDVGATIGIEIPNNGLLAVQSGRTLLSLSAGSPAGSDQETVNDTDMFEDALDDDTFEAQRPQTH
jgi:hypothetical protein